MTPPKEQGRRYQPFVPETVKIAPAATDSPIDPAVRAMFSSRIDPLKIRSTAIPITAAGYVAAIVWPAFSPRYAFAAPSTTHITSPSIVARTVNSFICTPGGTNGLCWLTEVSLLLSRSATGRPLSCPPVSPVRL